VFNEAAKSGHLPFDNAKIEPIVFGVLRKLTAQTIASLPDISEGLENRIHAAIRQAESLSDVYRLSKSKRYTSARIRRVIMAAFLGLDKSLCMRPIPYIHILGFNAKGREILSAMRGKTSVPVSDSMAYLRRQSEDALDFVDAETLSTDLYRLGLPNVLACGYDFTVDSVRL
jgi:predicted nucleotidyltransferase